MFDFLLSTTSNLFLSKVDKISEAVLRSSLASNSMPKKTKQEKLLAEYRRKLRSLEEKPHSEKLVQNTIPVNTVQYAMPKQIPSSPPMSRYALPKEEFIAIRRDLLKTLVIVSIFFVGEFLLWRFFR